MDMVKEYTKAVVNIFQEIEAKEKDKINQAAEKMATSILKDRLVHVFGSGCHSSIAAEQVLFRHEGLVNFNPILDPGITPCSGAAKAIFATETTPGYAEVILRYHRVKKDDVLIIASAYGVNVVTIETALEAKKIGAFTIAITSPRFSRSVPLNHPARHSSNKNLYEVVDLVINSHVPPEHVVKIEGLPGKNNHMVVGTLCQVFVVNLLVGSTIKKIVERGAVPERWVCALDKEGFEANKKNLEKYFGKVKSL